MIKLSHPSKGKLLKYKETSRLLSISSIFMLSCLCAFPLHAQKQMTLYHMQHIPQSSTLNPGRIPLMKLYVAVPALGSANLNMQTGNLDYNSINLAAYGNRYDFDWQLLNQQLDDGPSKIKADINVQALAFGAATKSGYFHIGVGERMYSDAEINEDARLLFEDMQQTNISANAQYDLDDSDLSGSYVRSYNAGYTHRFSKIFSAGIKFHYLEGLAIVKTTNQGLGFRAGDSEEYIIIEGAMEFLSAEFSQFEDFDLGFFSPGDSPGSGFAIDLGANYKLNDRWEFSISALNLGRIVWKDNLTNVVVSEDSEFAEYFGSSDLDDFNDGWDVLFDAMQDEENYGVSEKVQRGTPSRIFVGAEYLLAARSSVGAVIETRHSDVLGTNIGFGLTYNTRIGSTIGLSGAYTYTKYNPVGIGIGANFDLGPVQIYFVTDDLFSVINYRNANYATLQVGLNLVFGKQDRSLQEQYYRLRE